MSSMRLLILIFSSILMIRADEEECGDEAAAINDVESCSFRNKDAVFGGANLVNKPQTEETIANDAATQPIVIPCAYVFITIFL